MVGLLMVLFLSIGMAFAAEDINLNDNVIYDGGEIVSLEESSTDECLDSGLNSDESVDEDSDEQDNTLLKTPNEKNSLRDFGEGNLGSTIMVEGDTFEDIQKAIDSAKDNDTLIVSSAYGNGSQIIVNKSITIEGLNNTITILDARNLSRIFCILSDNVVIRNLNLKNGFRDDIYYLPFYEDGNIPDYLTDPNFLGKGAAIKWVGNNGKLIRCSLTENTFKDEGDAVNSGGVISWLGKNGTIIDSVFSNNKYEPLLPPFGGNANCYVIDKVFHGDYFGDLCGIMCFNEAVVNSDPVFYLKNVSTYYKSGDNVSFSLKANGVNCVKEMVTVTISRGDYEYSFNATVDSNGSVRFTIPKYLFVGRYMLKVEHIGDDYNLSAVSYITVKGIPTKVSLSKYNVIYNSGKKFTIKLLHSKTNNALSNQKLTLKVYTGKTYKAYKVTTDENGKASLDLSKLSAGKHKIVISGSKNLNLSKTTTISISKAKTVVKLSKNAFKYKRADKLKVTVTDRRTKKPVKNTKVTVKVFTGKKYKTYNLKTNQKGIIQINTKNLKKGTHKININSNNKFYTIRKNTYIKVK